MREIEIKIKDKPVTGLEIKLYKANLVLVKAPKGFVSCGYLDLNTAEKFSDAACLVCGVTSIEDLLKAKITGLTSLAAALGIKIGMTGQEALELML
ncbi:MAG: DUF1805 domain-containing protein [Candidatus Omnitrophota bacterium]|nr:DUF1805 domain-containing protein [Candidatus Omnitrophota bacterium]